MFLTDHARCELEQRLGSMKIAAQKETACGGEGSEHAHRGSYLARIVAALSALDAGTWGVCRHCGNPISPSRLFLRPETDRCGPCMEETARHA